MTKWSGKYHAGLIISHKEDFSRRKRDLIRFIHINIPIFEYLLVADQNADLLSALFLQYLGLDPRLPLHWLTGEYVVEICSSDFAASEGFLVEDFCQGMTEFLLKEGNHLPHLFLPIARTQDFVGLDLFESGEESAGLVESYLVDLLYSLEDLVASD